VLNGFGSDETEELLSMCILVAIAFLVSRCIIFTALAAHGTDCGQVQDCWLQVVEWEVAVKT